MGQNDREGINGQAENEEYRTKWNYNKLNNLQTSYTMSDIDGGKKNIPHKMKDFMLYEHLYIT